MRRSAEKFQGTYPPDRVTLFEGSYLRPYKPRTVLVASVVKGDGSEEIVGYISYIVYDTSHKDKTAVIYGLYVHAEKQKLGAGTKLLQAALNHIDMHALPTELVPLDPASKLYERNGFTYYKRLGYMIRPATRRIADRCALYPMM